MSHPRSNNSYLSREYSYKSQAINDIPMATEIRYVTNDQDPLWQNGSNSSTIQSSNMNNRVDSNSNYQMTNFHHNSLLADSYLVNDPDIQWRNDSINSGISSRMNTQAASNTINHSSATSYLINEPDMQWNNINNSILSPSQSSRVMMRSIDKSPNVIPSTQNIHTSSISHTINDDRDQFSIFGSFKKQRSERRDHSSRNNAPSFTVLDPNKYKTLPIKQQSVISNSSENNLFSKNNELNSSGYFTPQTQSRQIISSNILDKDFTDNVPRPVEDLIKEESGKLNQANPNDNITPILSWKLNQENSPMLGEPSENDLLDKDREINKLNKTIEKKNAKLKTLQKNFEESQKHLKNLLDDRKNLIKQIENVEFEEIIEEEEIQKGKSNQLQKEIVERPKSVTMKEEYVRHNFVEKSKISLSDLPQHILNNYRKEIMEHEREKMDMEKRALIESLNIQYKQQLQTFKKENEVKPASVKHVSIQSYKNTKFQQTVSDVNLSTLSRSARDIVTNVQPLMNSKSSQNEFKEDPNKTLAKQTSTIFKNHVQKNRIKTTSWQESILEKIIESLETNDSEKLATIIEEILFKPSKTIEITSKPIMVHKLSQNEDVEETNLKMAKETSTLFKNYIKKSQITTTKYQDSIIERFLKGLQTNNSDTMTSVIEELLFKSSKTVGINSVPVNSNKTIQTQKNNYNNISYDVNLKIKKPIVEKVSKAILTKPSVNNKGSQPEEKFYFETGTITDHLFYRSQGVMTVADYPNSISTPLSENESFVTRSSNRSQAKKQIKSQTTIIQTTSNNIKDLNKIGNQVVEDKMEMKRHEELNSSIPTATRDKFDEWEKTVYVRDTKNENSTDNVTKHTKDFTDRSILKSNEEPNIKKQETNLEIMPKSRQIVEEWEQKVQEKVQVLTAHVDKNQKLKDETQTTVECWETISKIKDGKLIEKSETYRDKYVSSNPLEIQKHLESHDNHDHSHTEQLSPNSVSQKFSEIVSKETNESNYLTSRQDLHNQNSENSAIEVTNIPVQSRLTENTYSTIKLTSKNVPILQNIGRNSFKQPNISNVSSNQTSNESLHSQSNESVTISERIEANSSLQSYNSSLQSSTSIGQITSPASFNSFSSRTGFSLSKPNVQDSNASRKEIQIISSTNNVRPTVFPKPIHKQTSQLNQQTNVGIQPINPTIKSSKIEINKSNQGGISSNFGSEHSAFSTISEQMIPVYTSNNETTSNYEVLLPENIFQLASQVLLWLNSNKHVCIKNSEHMGEDLIRASNILVDWWVDMVVKLTSDQLMTSVQYLISTFSKNFVKFLIINLDQQGNTCLHYIIGHQFWESFSVLNATGLVDPNLFNVQGFTVMMVASTLQVSVEILGNYIRKLAINANLNLQSKEQGQTAVFIAALHDNDNTIHLLCSLGADINIRDNEENTPLIIATTNNNIKSVKAILTCPNVLLDLHNKEGNTALKIAEANNLTEIIELFEERKTMRHSEMSSYSKILRTNSALSSPTSTMSSASPISPRSPLFSRKFV